MSKRIDWRKAYYARKRKLSIVDEVEWRNIDRAARWLAWAEIGKRGSKARKSRK